MDAALAIAGSAHAMAAVNDLLTLDQGAIIAGYEADGDTVPTGSPESAPTVSANGKRPRSVNAARPCPRARQRWSQRSWQPRCGATPILYSVARQNADAKKIAAALLGTDPNDSFDEIGTTCPFSPRNHPVGDSI